MNTGYLIVLILIIIYPILDAYRDSIVRSKQIVNHTVNALSYTLLTIALAVCLFFTKIPYMGWFESIEFVYSALIIRWIVFDISYNIFTGEDPFYIGHTSWMDRNIPFPFMVKALCLFFVILFNLQFLFR